jgi:hypothetical protein
MERKRKKWVEEEKATIGHFMNAAPEKVEVSRRLKKARFQVSSRYGSLARAKQGPRNSSPTRDRGLIFLHCDA